jgi:hypothetical protein
MAAGRVNLPGKIVCRIDIGYLDERQKAARLINYTSCRLRCKSGELARKSVCLIPDFLQGRIEH